MEATTAVPTADTAAKAAPGLQDKQTRIFRDDPLLRKLFDSIPSLLAILNAHRQIIHANTSLIEMLGTESEDVLLELRPGDVFD